MITIYQLSKQRTLFQGNLLRNSPNVASTYHKMFRPFFRRSSKPFFNLKFFKLIQFKYFCDKCIYIGSLIDYRSLIFILFQFQLPGRTYLLVLLKYISGVCFGVVKLYFESFYWLVQSNHISLLYQVIILECVLRQYIYKSSIQHVYLLLYCMVFTKQQTCKRMVFLFVLKIIIKLLAVEYIDIYEIQNFQLWNTLIYTKFKYSIKFYQMHYKSKYSVQAFAGADIKQYSICAWKLKVIYFILQFPWMC
eukprot:TRINITY_DN3059_c0_g4_i1.p2 TRINITY_DN3059_c0_g4~~TRINITY_DN3059_c0_g4_i1.p2  ORF type:complete len:249 (+),score=-21.13 TRINITY_DN3059_c0_g4_i1:150-896(+)